MAKEICPIDDTFHLDEWLTREMEKRGLDKYELSVESGLSTQAIYIFLRSGRLPRMDSMVMLLNALDKHLVIVDN